jgi:DNA modification methylase
MTDTVLVGDCCEVLTMLPRESVDLVVADPPYNIGIDYGEGSSADRRPDYWEWSIKWISLCARVLKPNGSLWVISGQEHGAEIDMSIQLQDLKIRNCITWHETFGIYCHRKFGRTSRPIFYAVKDAKAFTFNREAVTVPSARQTKYRDRRAAAGGKIMGDVWEISRVCGTHRERIAGVPTQLPVALVERIVGVSSNPGEVVLDPFAGSGTVPCVAKSMSRHYIGIEKSREFASIANARLLRTETTETPT